MPYWQKQPFPGLFIQSTLEHKTEVLHALQENILPEHVANRWFENAAILIQLLKDKQFEKAKETAEHFESSFPAMRIALLTKVLEKKQQQSMSHSTNA